VKRTFWITLAAVVAFGAILVARMPAAWLLPSGPKAPFSCTSIEGSLWSGACDGLIVQRMALGDVSWELQPLKFLLARLGAHVSMNRGSAHGSADVEVGFSGAVTARNLLADFALDPQLLPQLPPQLRGDAHADLKVLQASREGVLKQLQGTIEAHNLVDHAGHVTPLGSYVISFPGGAGEPVGQLRDLGGPLSVAGTLRLTSQGGFDVQALVAARPEATPELANNIKFLGSPDASGRRQFAMTGSF
jgi:hypothetical protein